MSYVICAELRVKPESADRFADVIAQHARNSVSLEPGCHAFEVGRTAADPGLFLLYEVYEDEAAYQAHRRMPSYQWFFEAGGPLLQVQPDGTFFVRRRVLTRAS
jgi:quinol monooxygenase YgiN